MTQSVFATWHDVSRDAHCSQFRMSRRSPDTRERTCEEGIAADRCDDKYISMAKGGMRVRARVDGTGIQKAAGSSKFDICLSCYPQPTSILKRWLSPLEPTPCIRHPRCVAARGPQSLGLSALPSATAAFPTLSRFRVTRRTSRHGIKRGPTSTNSSWLSASRPWPLRPQSQWLPPRSPLSPLLSWSPLPRPAPWPPPLYPPSWPLPLYLRPTHLPRLTRRSRPSSLPFSSRRHLRPLRPLTRPRLAHRRTNEYPSRCH